MGRPTPSFPGAGTATAVETHISVVTFVGDRVYKLKKPVDLGFLDFSTRDAREAACHREVELNRRLAPDVYLGVADVSVDGEVCDHLVVMRRMPDDRRLSTLVAAGDPSAADVMEDLAGLLVEFHRTAERSAEIARAARTPMVRTNWEESFHQLEPFVAEVLDEPTCRRVQTLVRRYLDGRDPLFDGRADAGRSCDGHGDLQAADIFCLDDGPRVLDCIEFADHYRHGDVIADVAFLVMDLERLGSRALAATFLDRYRQLAREECPESLVHHYIAYRAHVRAKVSCLRSAQMAGDDPDRLRVIAEATQLVDLALHHLEQADVRLVLVGGLPGTGKSTLARHLGERFGWTVIRSDEVRKELAGLALDVDATSAYEEGLYAPEMTERVYGEMFARARTALENGESIVLDASWVDAGSRQLARRLARDAVTEVVELQCQAPESITDARLVRRRRKGLDPSDATPGTARRMADIVGAWPEASVIDTTGSAEASLAQAMETMQPPG